MMMLFIIFSNLYIFSLIESSIHRFHLFSTIVLKFLNFDFFPLPKKIKINFPTIFNIFNRFIVSNIFL